MQIANPICLQANWMKQTIPTRRRLVALTREVTSRRWTTSQPQIINNVHNGHRSRIEMTRHKMVKLLEIWSLDVGPQSIEYRPTSTWLRVTGGGQSHIRIPKVVQDPWRGSSENKRGIIDKPANIGERYSQQFNNQNIPK